LAGIALNASENQNETRRTTALGVRRLAAVFSSLHLGAAYSSCPKMSPRIEGQSGGKRHTPGLLEHLLVREKIAGLYNNSTRSSYFRQPQIPYN